MITLEQYRRTVYVSCIIEQTARLTFTMKRILADKLGLNFLQELYSSADAEMELTEEKIKNAALKIIDEKGINDDDYVCTYRAGFVMPDTDVTGRIYAQIALYSALDTGKDIIECLFDVYHSFICVKLDNYRTKLYRLPPDVLFLYYKDGYVSNEPQAKLPEESIPAEIIRDDLQFDIKQLKKHRNIPELV